ncbi:glycoside hydrolase family 1 protein [Spiroplasma turonicum]|uniref:6-phospho-beta-glucosidase n=1 Tax=Spiroplasma turonicum TaxID=216946 RepID=A0A0K1P6H7_9MOLU|nr:glycoside hydrolase family 1 protein [Spiroplasma turonicum]AKU79885.1 6-phospho-beta-glucosidase [Spiroplasma turonicum]ALX70896.1 6-phospho-beta-glucosidase [Spiroplasma turonicum]
MKFTKYFLWGGSSSAPQTEGAYNIDGKSLTVADLKYYELVLDKKKTISEIKKMTNSKLRNALENFNELYFPKRLGINFYNTYKEDIKLLSELGINSFRISISWARIIPNCDDGVVNQKGLEFYRNVIMEFKKYKIEPIITLSHFDLPFKIVEKYGGWKNKKVIDLFIEYAKVVFKEFKNEITYWIPFNEINAALFSPWVGAGLIIDNEDNILQSSYISLHNLFIANSKAIKIAKIINSNFKIGCMIASFPSYPINSKPDNVILNQKDQQLKMYLYLDVMCKGIYPNYILKYWKDNNISIDIKDDELKIISNNNVDFISFSYYMTSINSVEKTEEVEANLITLSKNPFLTENDWGWQIDPLGLRYILNDLWDRYNLPLLIAENGVGFKDDLTKDHKVNDNYRISYLKDHIEQLLESIKDGVNVFGYLLWSPIDSVSSVTNEMSKRYGLIYVDLDDLGNGTNKRFLKDSYYWFKNYISQK